MAMNQAGFTNRWNLNGYRVLVTGSTKGIGLATAKELASLGADVCISSRTESDVQSTLNALRALYPANDFFGIAADVSQENGRAILLATVMQHWGGALDCLINNAGTNVRKPILVATVEDYNAITRANMDSVWFLCKAFHPLLMKSARPTVVNVASAAGVDSTGSGSVYAMTKAAVIQLTKVLACEWAKSGIRVNCISPWVTMTPLLEAAIDNDSSSLDKANLWTPMGRPANPEEIASAITFMVLPASSYITGHNLHVDGGLLCSAFAGPCIE
mmetsp:Transcript_32597/g.45230  ORF Transcript_32597/g.45230 Transcript_32597/m.45230 type:complete len:273 (+) Transcript_32597:187-1005(+)|eukprot:CAMPEP_0196581260 /NCGR_PEP_ID=MMETSP1081-20130531/33240_1 /TAXON_ID=36882 /ORGANISM="Pyramimonas amylifera, Strain CCMP720" /LENGTH=272 /DNA_ID=CAMNT_0041901421 /DNA_START=187 /DNA_END=1005 /DNA_ORIENTATION=+